MRRLGAFACALVLLASSHAWGQAAGTASGGSLWGKVTDETGAVLPGVTVAVEGPSLMGTQTRVTNEQGIYRFPPLPPGDFKVTFALPGFNTLVRDGIHITAAFTATVDVQLKVSTLAETVQVVGQSPVVDAVNARVQTNFSKEVLASMPAARDMWAVLSVSPAIQMVGRIDVGGSTAGTQTAYRAYGVTGQTKPLIEGIIGLEGNGSVGFYYDYGSFDEVNIQTAAQGAEMATPGVMQVFISKSGGNTFHGDFYTDYENRNLQARNLTDGQIARGVRKDGNIVWVNRDLNFGAGGPIMKDKLWYYGSFRYQHIEFMYPTLPDRPFLTTINDYTAKVTYQLPGNNKLIPYVMWGLKKQPYRHDSLLLGNTAFQEGEKSCWNQWNPGWVWKLEWNKTFGSSVFAEARVAGWFDDWHQSARSSDPRKEDLSTNQVFGGNRNWLRHQNRPQSTGAISYYNDRWGGSHNFKFGYELQMDQSRVKDSSYPGNVVNVLRNGVPSEVYFLASGVDSDSRLYWYSGYATDTWTRDRVSINAGLRLDHYRHMYPDQKRPASRFYTAEAFAGRDLTSWNLLAPRIGLSWDVSGGSKNVLKASYGRYYWNRSARDLVPNANPNSELQWRRYRWTDLNGNGVWDPGEEGALLATRGGVATQDIDPNLKDTYTDQVTFWFERELAEKFGIRAGFVWNRHSRRDATWNVLTPPEAYTIPVQVIDPGPDGRAGTADDGQVLNLLNLNPALIGKTLNVFMNVPNYHEEARNIEFVANRRFGNRWSMTASYAVTWRNDHNAIPYNPNGAPQSGYIPMTFIKLSGSVEPGWGLRLTPLVRYQSGTPYGRRANVSMNYGTQTVQVEPTGTRRMDAPLIFDLRTERRFALPKDTAVSVLVDVFNIANSNAEVDINIVSASTYQWPIAVLPPRVVRFGAKFSW
jgi:hypothetical protein